MGGAGGHLAAGAAALIATEDHRFFDHHGIDFYRLGGAMVRTFSGDKQGGSTLTQQLARNLFPDEVGRARSINRKLKEAITAAEDRGGVFEGRRDEEIADQKNAMELAKLLVSLIG